MKKGITLALSTAIISGFAVFASKILVAKIDPIVYTTLKNLFVAVILSGVVYSNTNLKRKIKHLTWHDWKMLTVIGIIGGGIPFALFFTGLKMTAATDATLIHKTLFIWVALFAIPILHERLRFLQMIGYVLVLWSVLWTSKYHIAFDRGELYIALATIMWALENVFAKTIVGNIPGMIIAWGRMTIGVVVLAVIMIAMGKAPLIGSLDSSMFVPFIIASLLLTGYVATYYSSLKHIPVTVASSLLILATPITALLEFGFLNKPIQMPFIQSYILAALGLACIVGLYLHVHRTQPTANIH